MTGSNPTDNLSARIEAAKERNQQKKIAKELVAASLATDEGSIQFATSSYVSSIMDRANELELPIGWTIRSGWEDIVPELTRWLREHDQVVSRLTMVVASGLWFSERLQELQRLWQDVYFYSFDGSSGYLVHHDRERGFETLTWG